MKYSKNKVVKGFVALVFIFILYSFSGYLKKYDNVIETNFLKNENSVEENEVLKKDSNLKIHYIDVGQADSILIEQNGHYMLIDGGNSDSADTITSYINNLGIKKFDYIIGTHPHEDHIGSLDDVILNFEVEKVLFPRKTSSTKTFENFVNAVRYKNLKLTVPEVGTTYKLGDTTFKIIAPNSSKYEEINNYSIVVKLTYQNTSYIFTGDAEVLSEEEIISKFPDELKCDVLKVAHHGSSSSTSDEFLRLCEPKYAIISLGRDNPYSHPHKSVLDRLKKHGIEVYRTDKLGTITLESDGTNIVFNR